VDIDTFPRRIRTHDGTRGRHNNYGFALSAQPGESRVSPEGAVRSPERPTLALTFIPQPTSELVLDIFVNQPEDSTIGYMSPMAFEMHAGLV
jgi:hypothetical protein